MKTVLAALAATVTALGLVAAPAAAAAPPSPGQASGAADFCAINIGHDTTPTCFTSPARLAAAETGRAAPSATQYLIARLYDNWHYNTDAGYLEIYAAANCTASGGNVDFQIADLGSWKDRVSSYKSFGLCAARLFTGTHFTGDTYPSYGFQANSYYVGNAMNDRTQSIQFS